MFYYDGTSTTEARELLNFGLVAGITTNITLVQRARKEHGIDKNDLYVDLYKVASDYNVPLSIQLMADSIDGKIDEAKTIRSLVQNYPNLHVKLATNYENFAVIAELSHLGIKVNATCVTSWMQAKLMATAGASIVSFFWGKMSDQGIDPYHHVRHFGLWRSQAGISTLLLVGSVRQTISIQSAFEAGADIVTTNLENIKKVSNQLASNSANELFLNELREKI